MDQSYFSHLAENVFNVEAINFNIWANPGLFFNLFSHFQTNITVFTQINVKNFPTV